MKCALLCMILWVLSNCRSPQNPVHSANNSFYTSPYSAWNNGPSPDPAYFPFGVWLQSLHRAQAYQAIGINTYVVLCKVRHPNSYKR